MYQAANDEQRYRIAVVLGHMGERNVIDTLLEALQKSSNWQVRLVAAETFVIIPDPNVIENLIDALNDQNGQVRISAAKALGRLGDPKAIPALEAACRLPENRGNAYSSEYTVEYFASGAIRIINQYTGKK
jgi:HEAT repeat protein